MRYCLKCGASDGNLIAWIHVHVYYYMCHTRFADVYTLMPWTLVLLGSDAIVSLELLVT